MFPSLTPGECSGLNTASSETFLSFFRGCNLHLIVNWRGEGGGKFLQLNCGRMEVTATMQLGTFGFIVRVHVWIRFYWNEGKMRLLFVLGKTSSSLQGSVMVDITKLHRLIIGNGVGFRLRGRSDSQYTTRIPWIHWRKIGRGNNWGGKLRRGPWIQRQIYQPVSNMDPLDILAESRDGVKPTV